MYYVYVLKSKVDGRFYKGITNDLVRSIKEHNSGKHESTREYIPWEIIYHDVLDNRIDARKREEYFKSGSGREFLKKIRSGSSVG